MNTDAAREWIAADPDPVTAAELQALVDRGDDAEVAERMAGPLEFGTAGLRGVIGAGNNRMNRAVVRRTSWGLGRWLLANVADAASKGVIVGHDARLMSREFAEDTAAVLAAMGISVQLFTGQGPTPLVAFGVLDQGAAAGVMVTASHNPAEYNGYKVYAEDGGQIVSPVDVAIAAKIAEAAPARDVPMVNLDEARKSGLVTDLEPGVGERWLARIQAESRDPRGRDLVNIVYTPIHGTGDRWAHAILRRFGFANVTSVPEQAEPDGFFPTAPFPNPEEKGVLDRAKALARECGANLILANDPDSDRLAVAIPERDGWRQLTGNEVGVLLGEYLLRHSAGDDRLFVNSIVSSPALGGLCKAHGVRFREVLTGFKWIARVARQEEANGARFVFGYEEALGYTVGTTARDKDGIGAAALFAELVAVAAAEGRTVADELDRIATTYGVWASAQHNVTRKGTAGLAELKATMERLRANKPARVGDIAVTAVRDLAPDANVLVFDLAGGARIIARPSGTEPKIKYYFDVREDVGTGTLTEARARAEARITSLKAAFVALAEG